MEALRIYILDDEPSIPAGLSNYLQQKEGFASYGFTDPKEFLTVFESDPADICLIDIKMPGIDGLEILQKAKSQHPDVEFIMISGHGDMDDVIHCMRYGAFDYIKKPFEMRVIRETILKTRKYIEYKRQARDYQQRYEWAKQEVNKLSGVNIIGASKAIQRVLHQMQQVASSDATSVLITGESGTGKELVARGIHNLSRRAEEIFYPINMTALTESLFESQLFGHNKGAFTGATTDKKGVFRAADQGTVFLDEIGDMGFEGQAKLLRLLEEKTVAPVGSDKAFPIDVRIIAATNKDLDEEVRQRKFRKDLFYRLNVFRIHLPPLRERREDIPDLFRHFIKQYADSMNKSGLKIHDNVFHAIAKYPFPGNIRELKNIAEHAVIVSENDCVSIKQLQHLFISSKAHTVKAFDNAESLQTLNLHEVEHSLIIQALKNAGRNKARAAQLLGISWQALDRRIKKYNIEQ
ncbi:MAG: sigma-54-dependent transcriptional regulator [Bacteroidota bacterium]